MNEPDKRGSAKQAPTTTSSEEARSVLEGYANDLREIVRKLRRLSSGS